MLHHVIIMYWFLDFASYVLACEMRENLGNSLMVSDVWLMNLHITHVKLLVLFSIFELFHADISTLGKQSISILLSYPPVYPR